MCASGSQTEAVKTHRYLVTHAMRSTHVSPDRTFNRFAEILIKFSFYIQMARRCRRCRPIETVNEIGVTCAVTRKNSWLWLVSGNRRREDASTAHRMCTSYIEVDGEMDAALTLSNVVAPTELIGSYRDAPLSMATNWYGHWTAEDRLTSASSDKFSKWMQCQASTQVSCGFSARRSFTGCGQIIID